MKNTNNSSFESALHKKMIKKEGAILSTLWLLLGVAVGFLLPQATVYGGFLPFGVSFAAAVSGGGTIPIFMAVLVG